MDDHFDELTNINSKFKTSQLALVQSDKMATLGQMVAGIAHEINTPLGYVNSNLSISQEMFIQLHLIVESYEALVDNLLSEHTNEEIITELMKMIVSMRNELNIRELFSNMHSLMSDSLYGLMQISELVHNLKDFSRVDAVPTEAINVNKCIETALNIGRYILKNKIEVIKEFGDLPLICCSPSQLNQVFLNLFSNAAQAINVHGQLHIHSWHELDSIYVSVTDNGTGIDPIHLDNIFDPFFTTKPVGEGTGLGLAISQYIIQKHKGEISVSSTIGTGTTFTIRLPIILSECK
jgi:signal transduction histidine kinase